MSLPVSPDEEGVMSDNAIPCGTTPSCVNAVSSISKAKRRKTKKEHLSHFCGRTEGGGKEDAWGIAIEEHGQRGLNLHPQAAELDREHAFILQ